ncbi:heme biosynthesis HemY N-terminal domain-containing protein [Bartonella sp. LJL80]
MVRVLLYILLVAVVGGAFAWVANNPGDIVMTFGANRVTVSVLTAVALLVLFIIVALCVIWLLRMVFSTPKNISRHFEKQRLEKGHEALSNGLLAVLSGDLDTARRMKSRVSKYLDSRNEPLVNYLEAQTLLLENDTPNAIRLYEEMSKQPQTRLAGLHGLFREAIKSGAFEAAGQYAEQATFVSPSVKWANRAMLDRLSADGTWDKAIALFDRAEKALPRAERSTKYLNHRRAVLLTGQAMDMFENHPDDARSSALKAQKLDPSFIPSTVVAADILYKLHEKRKSDKLVEALWQKTPHPDLAAIYLDGQEPAVERLKRAKTLAGYNPDHYDSCLIVARAAFDAGELKLAREQAEKAVRIQPRESAYLLLADIEEAQSGDQGLVRQWLSLAVRAERDPVWIADGVTFEEWAPVSPLSGRLDVYEWKTPSRHLGLALEPDEIMPSNPRIADAGKVIDAQDDAPARDEKTVSRPKEKKSAEKQNSEKLAADHVTIVDAIDPRREEKPVDTTRLNVDDPGIRDH